MIRAVLFDAYGTLFDVYSVAQLAEQIFPGHGAALADAWRVRQIDYTRIVSMSGRWLPFAELTRAGLRHAALQRGLALDAAAEDRLLAQYRQLAAFADVPDVLAALHARGVPCGILSNGDPDMLGAAVESAGLAPLLAHVISVSAVRRYKTDPACYALGSAAFGCDPADILFVSSNGWDAIGATWFGYTTLWVNRAGAPPEQLGVQPSRTGSSLRDVLDLLS